MPLESIEENNDAGNVISFSLTVDTKTIFILHTIYFTNMDAQLWLNGFSCNQKIDDAKIPKPDLLPAPITSVNEIETVRTFRVGGRRGPNIEKKSYFLMADAILSFLLIKEEASLDELIIHVEKLYSRADRNWLLLQVKQDLEHKGFIKSSLKGKSPFVLLMRKAFLKSELRKALELSSGKYLI